MSRNFALITPHQNSLNELLDLERWPVGFWIPPQRMGSQSEGFQVNTNFQSQQSTTQTSDSERCLT